MPQVEEGHFLAKSLYQKNFSHLIIMYQSIQIVRSDHAG